MRKKLRQIKDITEVIEIKKSKENNQIHLSQRLKYKPKTCEDCGKWCMNRRYIYSKLLLDLKQPVWVHQCNICRQYYNESTKEYNTSLIGIKKKHQ